MQGKTRGDGLIQKIQLREKNDSLMMPLNQG